MDKIIGALIGLVRACASNPKTANTDAVVLRALAFSDGDDAAREMIEAIHREKYAVSPGCETCASPCGNTDDYDMDRLFGAEEDICSVKLEILSQLQSIAPGAEPETDGLDMDLIHKALAYISYDWDRDTLLALGEQVRQMGRRVAG